MSFRFSKPYIIILVVVLIATSFFVGVYAGYENRPEVDKVTSLFNKGTDQPANVDFAAFWQAWNIVNEKYVMANPATTTASTSTAEPVTDQDKVYGAIQGLVKSLGDPYTTFFPPEEAKNFQDDISGNFSGVGMEIGIRDGVLTVVTPLKGTPAEKAGIVSGDKIIKIDERSTLDMAVDTAVHFIRGEKGTVVKLTVLKEGAQDVKEIAITRDTIQIPTIGFDAGKKKGSSQEQQGLRDDGIFVIRLFNFSAQSPELFREALQRFVNSGSNKLLLDLRGNPGGYLDAAVDMASWFLPSDKVVVSELFGREQASNVHKSKGYNIFNKNLKMVILINRGSASASEILAGALQEHGIAKLVGERSFGKGSVQELVPVTNNTQLKVTIARWFTPRGRSISEHGLTPDIAVKVTPEDIKKEIDPQFERAIKFFTTGR